MDFAAIAGSNGNRWRLASLTSSVVAAARMALRYVKVAFLRTQSAGVQLLLLLHS